MCINLYTKKTEKLHRVKLGHLNCIELICSFAPDKSGRYNGFWYANGQMANQLNLCQLEYEKVFHIHVKFLNKYTDIFIEQSPNPSTWEIFNSEKQIMLRHLGICFNNVDTFVETM